MFTLHKFRPRLPVLDSPPRAQPRFRRVVDSIAGGTQLSYDTLNRLTQVLDINGTITYSYNNASLRTNMTVAGQNPVAYFYDPGNRLTNVVQGTFTTSLAYDDDGRRTNLTLPNGINVVYLSIPPPA